MRTEIAALRMNLGVGHIELATISDKYLDDPIEYLRAMFYSWLQQCYDTSRLGQPSCNQLFQAIDTPTGICAKRFSFFAGKSGKYKNTSGLFLHQGQGCNREATFNIHDDLLEQYYLEQLKLYNFLQCGSMQWQANVTAVLNINN